MMWMGGKGTRFVFLSSSCWKDRGSGSVPLETLQRNAASAQKAAFLKYAEATFANRSSSPQPAPLSAITTTHDMQHQRQRLNATSKL
jgi:hypothetical protein